MWLIYWGPMKSLWFRIYLYLIVTLYQCTKAIPGFDRGLIELMRRALCDIFAASDSVWIFLWRLMNLIQAVGSPSCIFHIIVPDEIRKIHWIHGGADPWFPLCEDETATRWCGSSALSPHQNITLGSNIAFCSMLELFCCKFYVIKCSRGSQHLPVELHQRIEQCLIHCDHITILAYCSGHMFSAQHNSVQ